MKLKHLSILLAAATFLFLAAPADAQIWFDGNIYMKFLWGTNRLGTALYNYAAIPGEGLGDSGQGTQLELFLNGKLGKKIQFKASLQSRFYKNYWTNAGGYGHFCGGTVFDPNDPACLGSEFDPRSNQVIKLRNAAMTISPGYSWLDRALIGENSLGDFDPWVIGRIRYIDRFNISAIQLTGSANNRKLTWDAFRISNSANGFEPANGSGFNGGQFQPQDGTWGFQLRTKVNPKFDVGGLFYYADDIEVDPTDFFTDNGRDIKSKFTNFAGGIVAGIHPSSKFDVKGQIYYTDSETDLNLNGTNDNFGFAISGFDAAPHGNLNDWSAKVHADINDPWDNGLSFQAEYFNIGRDYVSMWAARREADVLITEGFDSAFAAPGPNNVAFGIFGGLGDAPQPGPPTRINIGYGGWSGETVQMATMNVDNQFTDFDEPIAETAIGWKGFTVKPLYASGNWDVQGEVTWIGYNTNWQLWDDQSCAVGASGLLECDLSITNSPYPAQEGDTGVGHNYRNAYAPFRDRDTFIGVAKAKYSFASGVQVWGKYKHIDETDNRMTDARFLPFQAGACPGGGVACDNSKVNFAGTTFYGNPNVITGADGTVGYQFKPFDSVTDDDRDLSYNTIQFGLGKQLHPDFYGSFQYEYYNADLFDGTTAFQAYQLHEMAGGHHTKNKLVFIGKYVLPGLPEAGFQFEHNFGSFEPDFGGGFVPVALCQGLDPGSAECIAQETNFHQPAGTLGFFGRFGGFNSIEKREFSESRFKGYLKILF